MYLVVHALIYGRATYPVGFLRLSVLDHRFEEPLARHQREAQVSGQRALVLALRFPRIECPNDSEVRTHQAAHPAPRPH